MIWPNNAAKKEGIRRRVVSWQSIFRIAQSGYCQPPPLRGCHWEMPLSISQNSLVRFNKFPCAFPCPHLYYRKRTATMKDKTCPRFGDAQAVYYEDAGGGQPKLIHPLRSYWVFMISAYTACASRSKSAGESFTCKPRWPALIYTYSQSEALSCK